MIKDQLKRTSVRNYQDKKIEQNKINKIKQVINSAPTAKNFQCFSAIFITKQSTKEKLSEINWNQKHIKQAPLVILFCADSNRLDMSIPNKKQHTFEEYVWSAIDATIASTMAMDCANELGLGCCFLGGIRFQADKIKKVLNLSGSITPVLGLCVGYPVKINPVRPKINKVYDEKYSLPKVKAEMKEYDKVMNEYYLNTFKKDTTFKKINAASIDKFDSKKNKQLLKDQFKLKTI